MSDNDDTSPSDPTTPALRIAFTNYADAIRVAGQMLVDAFMQSDNEWSKAIKAFKEAADAAIGLEQAQLKWIGYQEESKRLKQEDRLYMQMEYKYHARKDIIPTKNRKAPDYRFTQQHYSRN